MSEKNVAIVLAAGRGKRMHSQVAKQYLLINKKPILYYSLRQFEMCPFMDEVVLVVGAGETEYCRREVIEKYDFQKVRSIVEGGEERYHSVYHGLKAAKGCDYVYIHDGVRPFVTQDILERARKDVIAYQACVVGMPVKDTIKLSDDQGFCESTPERSRIWQIQTPQVFSYPLIWQAFEKLMEELQKGTELSITDDAMVVEQMTNVKVKLTVGAYTNLKITTPEDLKIAENLF